MNDVPFRFKLPLIFTDPVTIKVSASKNDISPPRFVLPLILKDPVN